MCVLTVLKYSENNGTEEIGLVTPTPRYELFPLALRYIIVL